MYNIFDRIADLKKIFSVVSERDLHYLVGHKISDIKHLHDAQPSKAKGVFMGFIWFLIRPWIKDKPSFVFHEDRARASKYFVYAGTGNQKKSLDGFVDAVTRRGESFHYVVQNELISDSDDDAFCAPFSLSAADVIVSQLIAVVRFKRLIRLLAYLPLKIRDNHYRAFLGVYSYLAYFLRVLRSVNPDFVVLSNDHSPGPRSLVAVANYLGIKTVYMQHASVSPLFPALRFSFAFLDGEKSMRIYEQCEKNWPADVAEYQKPRVYMSGQKKVLISHQNKQEQYVGLAVNTLDPIENIVSLVRKLQVNDIPLLLRWHPSQAIRDVERLFAEFEGDSLVQLSNPEKHHVAVFLGRIHTMIAGNSSIHLEAAIMGVKTIYYEIVPPSMPDYYGYVKEKISRHARSVEELLDMIRNDGPDVVEGREAAIKHYSETYGTPWYGKEGELVAETLHRIGTGQELDSLYDRVDTSSVFGDVYGINTHKPAVERLCDCSGSTRPSSTVSS